MTWAYPGQRTSAAETHDPAVAYLSYTGYRRDDFRPFLYKTDDYGETWTDISAGLPNAPINVVREDHKNPNLLFVGNELGVCAGRHFDPLQLEADGVEGPQSEVLLALADGEPIGVAGHNECIAAAVAAGDHEEVARLAAERHEALRTGEHEPVVALGLGHGAGDRWIEERAGLHQGQRGCMELRAAEERQQLPLLLLRC